MTTPTHSVGQLWDNRFASAEQDYLYGTKPNQWIVQTLPKLTTPAKVLALADGEGRNTIWLAQQGYQATNWDYSQVGLSKTQQLAQNYGMKVETQQVDLTNCCFHEHQFDAVVSSFFHLPKVHQLRVWQGISQMIKPNGQLVVQVFAESQLGRTSGGPKDADLLYQVDLFTEALSESMKIHHLAEEETLLDEGHLHQGLARVITLYASKKSD